MATIPEYFPQKRSRKASSKKGKGKAEEIPAQTDEQLVIDEDFEFLRDFDHDPSYGPATDISRLERYERAVKLGKNPDPRIKTLIEKHINDSNASKYTQSIWYEYKTLVET